MKVWLKAMRDRREQAASLRAIARHWISEPRNSDDHPIVGANNHGMTFVHTITICRHCGEELNDDSYPEDDCALAPAKTSKEEQTEC